ncbi:hypothetical protein L208DRAFT_825311 [Tricholoma matsutake]|nr:hypothetical protein L208DRAFT_825311 [Tricholoma matsutake 945]
MATTTFAAEQLLELVLQLKKTLAEHATANSPSPNAHDIPQPYSQPSSNGVYSNPAYGYNTQYQAYSQQYPAQPNQSALSDSLAAFPEEQRALIIRVLSMTPEQINALPPTERSAYIQLRATLGVPTG